MTGLVAFRVHYRPGTGRYQPPSPTSEWRGHFKNVGISRRKSPNGIMCYMNKQVLRILEIREPVKHTCAVPHGAVYSIDCVRVKEVEGLGWDLRLNCS